MRTWRVYLAAMAMASVTEGRIMLFKSPLEETTGSSFSLTQNHKISRRPTQKFGRDTPKNVITRTR